MEHQPTYEVKNQRELNIFLAGVLKDLRKGTLDHETARAISLVCDKINKNNVNAIEYKKITMHTKPIEFLEIDNLKDE